MAQPKRIAFCISGQPRTWKRCYRTWFNCLSHFGNNIDVFAHLWDFNTLPNIIPGASDMPADDIDDFIAELQPKKIIVDSKKNVSNIIPLHPEVKTTIFPPAFNQFYGVRQAAHLKRQYEIENDFEYDVVFRLRADLYLEKPVEPDHPSTRYLSPNTMYTSVNHFDMEFQDFRVGDIFYYANSYAYDQASRFYDFLSYTEASHVIPSTTMYPPEMAFYFYMKSIGLQNQSIFIDWKVVRPSYMLAYKELAPYEMI